MDSPYARIELSEATRRYNVHVPRQYNAAVDFVDRHVTEGRRERIAIIDDAGTTTYAQLAERTAAVAAALRGLGVVPEQRVVMCLHDTADFAAIFFGTIRAGGVAVPIDTQLGTDDYAAILADSRARVLFVSEMLVEKLGAAMAHLTTKPRVVVVKSPALLAARGSGGGGQGNEGGGAFETRVSRTVAHLELDAVLASAQASSDAAATTADDPAFWLYTSVAGGPPIAAIHLHSHLAQTAVLYGRGVLDVRENDVVFSAAKLFYAYGLGNALAFPLHVGATAVLLGERATSTAVLRTLAKHQPTIFCGVAALFAGILADDELAQAAGSPKLRVSVSAGEVLPKHTGEKWRARFGTDILDGFGSVEMLHIFLSNHYGDVRYGTSGKPVHGYNVKLVDERGQPSADGEEGWLWVRGPTSCVAYWGQREKSLATFHGPWTRTDYRYVRDREGYYTYAGRSNEAGSSTAAAFAST